ncbi:MAG: hypothetical protein HY975_03075 [Candidatus Kerfeldbacteria bacterium]|nr:hypothetical protein [Candidatus Kerfeldbacteria bacterium]
MFADSPSSSSGTGRDLQILTACPLCHANYNPLKTEIMAEREDAHLLYLVCRQCGSAVVAVVTTGGTGLNTYGMVTDLTSQEVAASSWLTSVSEDDLLDLHRWLDHDEHLTGLLGREKA